VKSEAFDKSNPNWSEIPGQNMLFLQSVQEYANEVLRDQEFLTLNEVYKMLGLEQNEEGALSGWTKDAYVDFGLSEGPIELTLNPNSTNVFRDK
jgi:hypothetical protein